MGTYKDLDVYKLSYEMALEVFKVSKGFPKDEIYGLTSQIRRSSRSICANIGEGYRKIKYPKYFLSKLIDIDGEYTETLIWIDFAKDFNYIDNDTYRHLSQQYSRIGSMLGQMIKKHYKFHNNHLVI